MTFRVGALATARNDCLNEKPQESGFSGREAKSVIFPSLAKSGL